MELNSIDDNQPNGENGFRSSWHLLFNLPSNEEGLAITIENREIVKEIVLEDFDSSYQNEIFKGQINFNSDEIIKIAISDFKLEKGNGQDVIFSGYHYKLIEDQGIQFLTVVGTIDSKLAEIHFDAQTGEQIGWTETN
ncbi:hypothetical protein [Shouchella lehensis]|uniref:Uncharacterized protein n=1 Tax=Shouchella lehensis TaxID=300825 RepID=A0A4Y7WLR8_9BACI|nr:hypothetical protein [Shouchella lehensis]MBG9783093.1 hypothetical protein [Shouchella lehensis]TES49545.1 hypothetical protein E2L03_08745 [Shouchella lehensis]